MIPKVLPFPHQKPPQKSTKTIKLAEWREYVKLLHDIQETKGDLREMRGHLHEMRSLRKQWRASILARIDKGAAIERGGKIA